MMNCFFSIVIPTLNEERYLPRLLKDLKNQTDRDFEVIVVDGKSEDATKKKAGDFASELPLFFHEVDRRNVSFQRNFGASKSKGSYIVFIDADCRINPSFTKRLKSYIEKYKGLVLLPYVDPEENNPQTKAFYQLVNFLIQVSQAVGKPFSSVGSIIVEKNFFFLIKGFEDRLFIGEDHSLIQKAQEWGVRAKTLKNIKIKFSFRRIQREGKIQSLYKLLIGTVYMLFKGDIEKKIFDYDMGGHLYDRKIKKSDRDKYLKQIKDFFARD